MSSVALARPGTATSAIVVIGGTTFKIHTQNVEIQVETKVSDVTGQAQATPNYQHAGMSYVSFRCTGFVISGANAIGVAKLANVTDNKDTAITFNMHNNRTISGKAVFTSATIAYGRTTPHVQVALAGVFTDTADGVVETATA
jgi:uncharacterized protein (DUF2225 family)